MNNTQNSFIKNVIYVNFRKVLSVGKLLPKFEHDIVNKKLQSNTKAFYINILKHVKKHLQNYTISDMDANAVIDFLDKAQNKNNEKFIQRKQ